MSFKLATLTYALPPENHTRFLGGFALPLLEFQKLRGGRRARNSTGRTSLPIRTGGKIVFYFVKKPVTIDGERLRRVHGTARSKSMYCEHVYVQKPTGTRADAADRDAGWRATARRNRAYTCVYNSNNNNTVVIVVPFCVSYKYYFRYYYYICACRTVSRGSYVSARSGAYHGVITTIIIRTLLYPD